MLSWESGSLLVTIRVLGRGYKGAQSASEVSWIMGSASVASVQGLAPVALGQDSTAGREGGMEEGRTCSKLRSISVQGFPGGASGKQPACQCRRLKKCQFDPWIKNIPWRRKRQPTPVFLPGNFLGQRSLVGFSPWGSRAG